MHLTLVRHGITEENEARICQGHLPGTLTPEGIEQAELVARRLQDEEFDIIYASDLARAADTANAIAAFHPDVPLVFREDLRERFFGAYQGMQYADIQKVAEQPDGSWKPAADAETTAQLLLRAERVLTTLLAKHPVDRVLVVAHGGINRAIIVALQGLDEEHFHQLDHLKNTSVCSFDIDEERNHTVHVLDCTKHLD